MLKITNVKVYGLEESIIASGYPKRLDFPVIMEEEIDKLNNDFEQTKDYKRMVKLGNTPIGSGHSNAIKGIIVQFDLKYPNYFTPQLQRYKFLDIISSSSKMHLIQEMNMRECFNEYVTPRTKDYMVDLQNDYNQNPSRQKFMTLLANCPMGIELNMRCSASYTCLRNIYYQRHNHKLLEWKILRDWIKSLPYFSELCLAKENIECLEK